MNEKLYRDFIASRDAVRKVFRMESAYIYPICANIFCARGVQADPQRLRDGRDILREKTGAFSNFRGTIRPLIISLLAVQSDPEGRLERAVSHYKALKERFWGSQYLALAAFLMTDLTSEAGAAEKVARGRALYERMKAEHPLLTSSEDSVFAVLLAFSAQSDDALLEDMERCYALLKKRFHQRNAVQSSSHVLSLLPGTPEEKVGRMLTIYDRLLDAGGRYGKSYQLPTLAAMAGLDADPETLVREMLEADRFLAGQKGYGVLGLDRRTRMMHAAMLVSDAYSPRNQVDTAAMAGTISLIAAQQAAMCAVIASTSATAASASSH